MDPDAEDEQVVTRMPHNAAASRDFDIFSNDLNRRCKWQCFFIIVLKKYDSFFTQIGSPFYPFYIINTLR
jgi:hypothetical protein